MGSLLGMYVAMNFIQNRLNPMDTVERSQLSDIEFAAVRDSDLMVLIAPYLIIGLKDCARFRRRVDVASSPIERIYGLQLVSRNESPHVRIK